MGSWQEYTRSLRGAGTGVKAEAGSSVPCTHVPRGLGVPKSFSSHKKNRFLGGNKNISSSQVGNLGFVPQICYYSRLCAIV